MNERERSQPKWCSICKLVGHSKIGTPPSCKFKSSKLIFFYYQCISFHIIYKLIKHSSTVQFNNNVGLQKKNYIVIFLTNFV